MDTTPQWWQRLDAGEVTVQRCRHCDHEQFPVRVACRGCTAVTDLTLVPLRSTGTVVAATTLHRAGDGAPWPVPYTLGYARFAADVHLLGLLTEPAAANVVAGTIATSGEARLRLTPASEQ